MLLPAYISIVAAFIFYLVIPLAGAFGLRSQWRRFRRRVIELSLAPLLSYRDIARASRPETPDALGRYRLFGKFEALEGRDKIWVRGADASAVVDLSKASVFTLSSGTDETVPVERIAWRSISSLADGTSVFVGGLATASSGRIVFVDSPEEPLIVVLHDGSPEGLLSRLVAGGRGQNEYWNPISRVSVASGILATSLVLVTLLQGSTIPSIKALAVIAGLAPFLPLAPPGLFFFLAYRRLWRRALTLRAARDLLRLPLRYFGDESACADRSTAREATLPGGGRYERRRLEPGEIPPRGSSALGFSGMPAKGARGARIAFYAVDSSDPAAENVVMPDEPELLARAADAKAQAAAIGAGLLFTAAVAGNYVLTFLAWRALS
jgi:hypothetical protein